MLEGRVLMKNCLIATLVMALGFGAVTMADESLRAAKSKDRSYEMQVEVSEDSDRLLRHLKEEAAIEGVVELDLNTGWTAPAERIDEDTAENRFFDVGAQWVENGFADVDDIEYAVAHDEETQLR